MSSRVLILAVLALGLAATVQAQSLGRVDEMQSNTAYFFHVRPGEKTIQVFALGAVGRPGIYEVGVGTDLRKLVTLTGGAEQPQRGDHVRREVTLRLIRQQGGVGTVFYDTELEDFWSAGTYPLLEDGDMLLVEVIEHRTFDWQDVLAVVGSVSALIIAAERVTYLLR